MQTNWRYVVALNSYRKASGTETIAELKVPATLGAYTPGGKLYILFAPDDWSFAKQNNLKIVYRRALSQLELLTLME